MGDVGNFGLGLLPIQQLTVNESAKYLNMNRRSD
jgi:hypothetical protein